MKLVLEIECRDVEDLKIKFSTELERALGKSHWKRTLSYDDTVVLRPNPNLEHRSWINSYYLASIEVDV